MTNSQAAAHESLLVRWSPQAPGFSRSNQPEGLQLYQKETPTQVFSCEYCEILKNSFFYRTPLVAASSAAPENGVL